MNKESIKIFIASSAELEQDRKDFRLWLSNENDKNFNRGIYLKLEQWEYFLDSVSQTGKQDDYNQKLKECDIVICLFYKKAGKYTQQEFDTALKQFHETGTPLIYTYFKEPDSTGLHQSGENEEGDNHPADDQSRQDLEKFKKRLNELGHFYSRYKDIDHLINQFGNQLDFLKNKGYEKLQEDFRDETKDAVNRYLSDFLSQILNNKKPANKFLCRKLIDRLKDSNEDALYFLENDVAYSGKKDKWETDEDLLGVAKTIIISAYASVLGGFLSKLIASDNQRDYFEIGLVTTKRTLQLLCFAFISSLWDYSKEKVIQLSDDQQFQLKRFFRNRTELNISEYAELFKSLVTIFKEKELAYPIPEVKSMEADFLGENIFSATCKTLESFRTQFFDSNKLPAIDEIERALTSFLVAVSFLANYKMVSIKDIGYESVRNSGAQFLHAYTILGEKNGNSTNGDKYKYYDKPLNTEAVVLFRENYLEGLNLFPFIIDKNGLKNRTDDLPQIFFYGGINAKEKKLVYVGTYKTTPISDVTDVQTIDLTTDTEDIGRKLEAISNSMDRDVTDFKTNKEKYEHLKKYEWYLAFKQARQTFCGADTF